MSAKPLFVFDVESVGLHGEGFAVGWVVMVDGVEVESGYAACPMTAAAGTASDRKWVEENVGVYLPPPEYPTPGNVREVFWGAWMSWKEEGAIMVADCAWPVEARFLAACVDHEPEDRRWDGPYPLHDVATARLVSGLDPLATVDRLPTEEPKHHPTADARQSARLWAEAMR